MVSIISSFKFSLSSAAMLNLLVGVGSLPDSAVAAVFAAVPGTLLKEEAAALTALSGVHARPLHQC